jgi:hypothetical protein
MNPPAVSTECSIPDGTPFIAVKLGILPYRMLIYLACTVLVLVLNYFLGKDMASDTLNYHLYAGFSAVNDRFAQDYFAAGPLAYFNPYSYIPFYALISAGLPALAVSSLLAAVHSIILWLTFELAILVSPSNDPRARTILGLCSVALAFMNPILIQEVGSSFADITTGELVLGGWVLLAAAMRAPSKARIVAAGLLIGIATGLKPTNAVHAIAAIPLLLMAPLAVRARIRSSFSYLVFLGIGFVIAAAPWAYQMERIFGNPMFPLMNSVFRSPDFTTAPLLHFRFVPATFGDALLRPFAMVKPLSMVHEELRAPDVRYAVLTALSCLLACRWVWRFVVRRHESPRPPQSDPKGHVLAAVGCSLAIDWVLWLCGSGNSRYFLPIASVAAVVLVALVFQLFISRPRVRNYILAAVIGAQAIQLWMGTDFRWNPVPWGGQWFKIAVPEKLLTEPDLYLSIGIMSNSFVAPFLSRNSGFVNFSGGYALGSEGASGAHIHALIARYSPHLRVLVAGNELHADADRRQPRRSQIDALLARFGLRVDPSDCATIAVYGLPPPLEITVGTSRSAALPSGNTSSLVTCHLVIDDSDHSGQKASQRAADLVLDRLEDACPELFQPPRLVSEPSGSGWQRLYMNTDLIAWVSQGWVKFRNPVASNGVVYVGRESDFGRQPLRVACGRRDGHYFAKVMGPMEGPQ